MAIAKEIQHLTVIIQFDDSSVMNNQPNLEYSWRKSDG